MLKIRQELMTELRQAEHIHHVRTMLAGAVRLELSTIPTYLTALFSIKPGQNQEARALVQSVVVEEMLHMTLAANTLIAIGGNPRIIEDGQALNYPGPLPMCVDTSLTVTLKALSRQQAQEVFMEIERPDTQAILPGETQAYVDNQPGFDSIGRFYQAILERLQHLENHGHDCFAQPRLDEQVDVSQWFPHEVEGCPDGKVHDMASARAVINTIVRQGEGVQVEDDWINPKEDAGGGYAHYFKFGEIYYGKRLVRDDCSPSGWSYTGEPVPLDETGVFNLLPNAALSDYPAGSGAAVSGAQFYQSYQNLLAALDRTFNGQPQQLDAAIGIMYELKLVAQKVMQHPVGTSTPDVVAAPPFMRVHQAS
ncbi:MULTISPECIES: ferritin-like protein [Chromobacterium]|uniref:Ferritin-like protein n=1 Tax=Chromobacterium aquaticum TaxID=467180 RepID=A0ABV8ZWB3_9NEIS|nr:MULTISPECIES: ferritin-like protein [Chromobacterium]MCD5361717.1 ferritin-like protein [Chromobacterium aquaticum]